MDKLFHNYEIVPRYGSDSFECRRKDGKTLLVTQHISLDTLIRLALEDLAEGIDHRPGVV